MSIKKNHRGLLSAAFALLFAALLVSCREETLIPTEPDRPEAEGYIMFGTPSPLREFEWRNGRASSRAGEEGPEASRPREQDPGSSALAGEGGSHARAGKSACTRAGDIDSDIPENIGVFAFGDGPNTTYIFRNQKVFYRHGQEYLDDPIPGWSWPETPVDVWPYTTEPGGNAQRPWEKMRYRFFAYSPWYPTADVSVSAENYSGFNTFTWNNIPGFTDKDFVLCNEISDVDNREGSFTSMGNVIHFRMRHILSRIRFFFKMSKEYHQIRRIELNSITILTAGKVKSATFNFRDNAWDETVHWSNEQPGNSDPVTLTSADGLSYDVPVEYPADPFTSVYVYPQDNFSEIKLQIDYTVYDSQGVATRYANLVNSVTLPGWKLLSGYYYDIRISIAPSYMYVLSDNDQTFDGYVIIKDAVTPPAGE